MQVLDEQSGAADWTRATERRGLGTDVNEVIVQMVATGGVMVIAAGVKQSRQRSPRYKVDVEGEDDGQGVVND